MIYDRFTVLIASESDGATRAFKHRCMQVDSDDAGRMVGEAVRKAGVPRPICALAFAIAEINEWDRCTRAADPTATGRAEDELINAAYAYIRAWEEHDKARH